MGIDSSYPVATTLGSQDLLFGSQFSDGEYETVNFTPAAIAGVLGAAETLAPAITLEQGTLYFAPSSGPSLSVYLPPRTGINQGLFAVLVDRDNNIGASNVNIYPSYPDVIADHAASDSPFPWVTSNTILLLFNTLVSWRIIAVGG